MSQYEYTMQSGKLTVRFGWDPPLETYYFQIKDNTGDDGKKDPMVVWVGTKPRELYEIEDLVKAIPAQYTTLVQRHEINLYADKDDGK